MKTLILILVSIIISACADKSQDALKTANECFEDVPGQTRLVTFGESQMQGIESQAQHCKFSYVYVLANTMGLNIVNRAIGGSLMLQPSAYGPSQKDQIESTQFQPTDTVIWMTGYNDGGRFGTNQTYFDAYAAQLPGLITLMATQTAKVYILTPLKLMVYNSNPAPHALYHQFIIDTVAALNLPNVELIDTDLYYEAPNAAWLSDHAHINSFAQMEFGLALSTAIH